MKKIIPFSWTPTAWALRGQSRKIAQAEYEYSDSPYERDVAIAELTLSGNDLEIKLNEINFEYQIISEYDYEKKSIELTSDDELDKTVRLLQLDIDHNLIDPLKGDKEIANALKQPWVKVINDNLDLTDGPNGYYMEFDWNDHWIAKLRDHGYTGISDEEVMEKWFSDVCRQQISQTAPYDGSVIIP